MICPIWPHSRCKSGRTEGADEDGVVSLSSAGVGEVMYKFDTGTYDPGDPCC